MAAVTSSFAVAQAAPPDAVSRTWSAVTGAQSDLFFPDSFLGEWTVRSCDISCPNTNVQPALAVIIMSPNAVRTCGVLQVAAVLKSVETPMGMEYVQVHNCRDAVRACSYSGTSRAAVFETYALSVPTQDARVVDSARAGLGGQVQYPQRFVRNSAGRVVPVRSSRHAFCHASVVRMSRSFILPINMCGRSIDLSCASLRRIGRSTQCAWWRCGSAQPRPQTLFLLARTY